MSTEAGADPPELFFAAADGMEIAEPLDCEVLATSIEVAVG